MAEQAVTPEAWSYFAGGGRRGDVARERRGVPAVRPPAPRPRRRNGSDDADDRPRNRRRCRCSLRRRRSSAWRTRKASSRPRARRGRRDAHVPLDDRDRHGAGDRRSRARSPALVPALRPEGRGTREVIEPRRPRLATLGLVPTADPPVPGDATAERRLAWRSRSPETSIPNMPIPEGTGEGSC